MWISSIIKFLDSYEDASIKGYIIYTFLLYNACWSHLHYSLKLSLDFIDIYVTYYPTVRRASHFTHNRHRNISYCIAGCLVKVRVESLYPDKLYPSILTRAGRIKGTVNFGPIFYLLSKLDMLWKIKF